MRIMSSVSSVSFRRLALTLVLMLVSASAIARADDGAATRRNGPPAEETDAYGRVVRTTDGARRLYSGPAGPAGPKVRRPRPVAEPGVETAVSGDLRLYLEWYGSVMGYAIGLGGLEVADLDGDGRNEIVVVSDVDNWKVLAREGSGYDQIWASLPAASGIDALRVVSVGGEAFIILGYGDGTLELVAGDTRLPLRTISTGATEVRGLTIANVGGRTEALFCDPDQVFTVDLETSAVTSWAMACVDLAVGQVDNDPGLEIVVATSTDPAYILDAATGTIEWTNNLGFGSFVEVGDLDGDGRDEVAAGAEWSSGITVFNVETHSIGYTVPIFDLAVMRILNADGDSELELLYGDGQWGAIHVLNGADGTEDWSISNPEHGVTGIAFGNVDEDPAPEVLWGAGYTSSGPDNLFVGDGATHLQEWHSLDDSGGFYALGGGDVDADGSPEIYYGSMTSNSGYDSGRYFIRDGATRVLERSGLFDQPSAWGELWRMTTADALGDAHHELFLAGSRNYDGELACLDLLGAEQWRVVADDGTSFRSLGIANVDADSHLEVVASVGVETTGATGVSLYVYDAQNGTLEWKSPSMGLPSNGYSLLRIAQVDGDGAVETVLGGIGGRIWVWDMQSHLNEAVSLNLDVSALDVADVNGDGVAEIFIGTSTGLVRKIDAATGDPSTVLGPLGGRIDGMVLHDFTGDGTADYVFGRGPQVEVRDGSDGSVRWASGFLNGYFVGQNDTLRVGDFDGDGEAEILVSLWRGVAMFGDDARVIGLSDGFESGGTFKWLKSM